MIPLNTIILISIAIILIVGIIIWRVVDAKNKWKTPTGKFPDEWRKLLMANVSFYKDLSQEDKEWFEFKVQEFLLNCRVTGIQTKVDTLDKLLVASSAVIPIFSFKEWKYINLEEVLLYPNRFNEDFETEGEKRHIMGMVGNGYMEGMMILSKPALRHGFQNETDKKNTAIHEFVHLIDKLDGSIDGIPSLLISRQYTIPWIDMINKKIDEIFKDSSDINPYGGTNRAEFFSVVSEYFFERPNLLAKKHPDLYHLMEQIFDQKLAKRRFRKIKGNKPCPCNSGKKFKNCCGKKQND